MARGTSPQSSLGAPGSMETPGIVPDDLGARTGRSWLLWFPVRPGPPRKRKVRLSNGGHAVVREQRLELPPTKNTRDGHVHVHNAWVQEWREAARVAALVLGIPPLERIRLSAIVYRDRLGIADAENDHARLAPLQDGLVDAGVVPKDTYRYVERGTVREMRALQGFGPGIELLVEETP